MFQNSPRATGARPRAPRSSRSSESSAARTSSRSARIGSESGGWSWSSTRWAVAGDLEHPLERVGVAVSARRTGEPLRGELADRLEHPEALLAEATGPAEQALVEERGRACRARRRRRLGGLERAAAAEAEGGRRAPARPVEKVVATRRSSHGASCGVRRRQRALRQVEALLRGARAAARARAASHGRLRARAPAAAGRGARRARATVRLSSRSARTARARLDEERGRLVRRQAAADRAPSRPDAQRLNELVAEERKQRRSRGEWGKRGGRRRGAAARRCPARRWVQKLISRHGKRSRARFSPVAAPKAVPQGRADEGAIAKRASGRRPFRRRPRRRAAARARSRSGSCRCRPARRS